MARKENAGRSSVSYAMYEHSQRSDVINLQRMLWSSDLQVNSDYLSWKYESNPYLSDVHICLAIHDGNVVGMRGAWGSCWKTGDAEAPVIVPCVGDMVIAPAYRGQGVLRGFNEFMSKHLGELNFPFLLSPSASKPVYFGSLKVGWKPVLEYAEIERFPAFLRNRRARKIRNFVLDRGPLATRRMLDLGRSRNLQKISVPDIESGTAARAAAMAQLAAAMRPDRSVGPIRDEEYYAWRFRCPLSRYVFLYAGKSLLDGFLVLQHKLSTPYVVSIVDWEASSDSVFERLLAAAIEVAGKSDLQTWSTSIPPDFDSRLRLLGFRKSGVTERNGYQQSLMIQQTTGVDSDERADDFCKRLRAGSSCNVRMILSDDY